MKERFEISDAVEQISMLVDESNEQEVLNAYKFMCNPNAVLVEEDGEYFIEIDYGDE